MYLLPMALQLEGTWHQECRGFWQQLSLSGTLLFTVLPFPKGWLVGEVTAAFGTHRVPILALYQTTTVVSSHEWPHLCRDLHGEGSPGPVLPKQ